MTDTKIQGDWGEANRGVGQEIVGEGQAAPPETKVSQATSGVGQGVGPTIDKAAPPPQPDKPQKT